MTPEQIEKDIAEVTKVYKDKPRSDLIASLVIAGRGLETHKNINAALVSTLDRLWLFNNHLMSLLEEKGIELSAENMNEFIDLAKRELSIRVHWDHESRQFAAKSDRSTRGKKAIEARHDKEGGSRDARKQLRDIWAQGNFSTRTDCAEQERGKFEGVKGKELSLSQAIKYLRNTPDPDPWPADPKRKGKKK